MAKSYKHIKHEFNILEECRVYATKYFHMDYETLTDEDKNKIYNDVGLLRKS